MISETALKFIKLWEGFSPRAYQCSAGTWTIGYGETMWKGKPVRIGQFVTIQEADDALVQRLQGFQAELDSLVDVPLNANQNAALLSFIYNVGASALRRSTLLKILNKGGNYAEVADQFLVWDKVGKKPVRGLTHRREAERKLFLTLVKG
jgi:lysozyme